MYSVEENNNFIRYGSIRYMDMENLYEFTPVFQSIHIFQSKRNYVFDKHCHPAAEILIPQKDGYECTLNGKHISVEKGGMLLVQTGDNHQDILKEGIKFDAITFFMKTNVPFSNTHFFKDDILPDQQVVSTMSHSLQALLEEMKEKMSDTSATAFYILNGLFQAFFWEVIALIPENNLSEIFIESSKQVALRRQLSEVFENHVFDKLSVKGMAKELGFSESSLAHKCKNLLNITPSQAFISYKMKRAEQMLAYSNSSIKEISDSLGFENQFHFSRLFKKHAKQSPTTFRKIHSSHLV